MHLDWAASQFLTKQIMIGLVGYVYDELSCDSGSGDRVGCFVRVLGVGPQIGFLFPLGSMQGYLNLKAYGEFDAANRPFGWDAWVTLVISPAAVSGGQAAADREIAYPPLTKSDLQRSPSMAAAMPVCRGRLVAGRIGVISASCAVVIVRRGGCADRGRTERRCANRSADAHPGPQPRRGVSSCPTPPR